MKAVLLIVCCAFELVPFPFDESRSCQEQGQEIIEKVATYVDEEWKIGDKVVHSYYCGEINK